MAERGAQSAEEGSVEAGLQELESLVKALEGGSLPLDEAMQKFERGVALVRSCRDKLDKAEQRIQMLVRDGQGDASLVDADLEGSAVRPKR